MDKWLRTMEVFEEYERRFAAAASPREGELPFTEARKSEVREKALRMLGIKEEQIPDIQRMTAVSETVFSDYRVLSFSYESFPRCFGAADLYLPKGEGPFPITFLFAGHGDKGRKTPSYRAMCHRLAASGIMVVSPDGMGQGDRAPMGHRTVYPILSLGITLQGVMVLEALALIRFFSARADVDKTRVAACGNSGGGTLCLLLAALCPELTALASTGYPSEFGYILSKERRHCACNLLPGCAHGPRMWELLASFAPRPLLIEQGEGDHLIPYDLFMRTARKVAYVYRAAGAQEAFSHSTTKEGHSWAPADIAIIADFLCRSLGLEAKEPFETPEFGGDISLPSGFATTYEVAEGLTGRTLEGDLTLADIYRPTCRGIPINASEIIPDVGRGDVMQVLAQMECALKKF